MKLKKILLRYFPPGITLEYIRSNGEIESKCIDLLNLSSEYIEALCSTNIDQLIDEIVQEEPLITETRRPQIRSMIVSKLTLYCRADRKD